MMVLVTGGSKCGKSSFAESIILKYSNHPIYLATMQPYGEEAQNAIERHRKMREGKGFQTIEKFTDIDCISISNEDSILLECIGNLVANEMFRNDRIIESTKKIIDNIIRLSNKCKLLVIVSNQVSNDGITYDISTQQYIKSICQINHALAQVSTYVFECVYGIPIQMKGL